VVKIEAIVSPQAAAAVAEALDQIGCAGLSMQHVHSDVGESPTRRIYRGLVVTPLESMRRIEVVIPERRLEEALEVIGTAAREAGPSDGRLLVIPVADVHRIRTGERGEDAVAA
jgi:nitrogen regulatory protein P-II 1